MTTISMPQQPRSAEVRAASYDKSENSVELIWTTGATVRRRSWRGEVYDEELTITPAAVDLSRLNAGAPFLNSHQSDDLSTVIGSVIPGTARIDGGKGLARVKLSNALSDADIVGKIRDAIIKNVSVGYSTDRIEIVERADNVPLWRVTRWTPIELSAVAIPADAGAQIRSGERSYPATIVEAASIRTRSESSNPWESFIAGPKSRVLR